MTQRHVPDKSILAQKVLSLEESLRLPENPDYDPETWLYAPPFYADYRYILGTRGARPLIVIGLNPSTARPGRLDNTLKSVQRVAAYNGFDSFLMLNLYAQRATLPRDMDREVCDLLHEENVKAFSYLLKKTRAVWAAWGAVMETRGFLTGCMRDFVRAGQEKGAQWFTAGPRSKAGHPHHPLYLKKDSDLESFDMEAYLWLMENRGR